ncbi:MAG: protein kinase [Planctomycetota bacterium]|jgi:serine/threonine-protein kinase|nr:protein kinase [Planctomycetota bacterium]MDP7250791.1 protein kinase [Planctomycetota bacterium]
MSAEEQPKRKIKKLAHYLVIDRLGQGGMGIVYQATDTKLDRPVALKILASKYADNERYVGRFLREGQTAAAMNHPNIVAAYDVGKEGNYYYFAMEHVEGVNLQKRVKEEGKFTEKESIDLVLQVAGALQHAARKSIIHRDIKPENVMVTNDGLVKLLDLGLAKATDNDDATLTQAGRFIGTPQYSSPEQVMGDLSIDGRTDIYSLGIMLFRFATGTLPFKGETAAVIAECHLKEPMPDPHERNPELSAGICDVIRKMTEKEPAARYQTPDELIEDLKLVRKGEPPIHAKASASIDLSTARSASTGDSYSDLVRKKASSSLMLVAASLVVGGLLLLAYFASKKPEEPELPEVVASVSTSSTTTTTSIPVSVELTPDEIAREQFDSVVRHIREHPAEFAKNLRKLEEAGLLLQGTRYSKKAEDQAASIQTAFDKRVNRAQKILSDNVQRLIALGDFSKALKALEVSEGLSPDVQARIRSETLPELRQTIETEAKTKSEALFAEARNHSFAGDFQRAEELLQKVEGFGLPKLQAAVGDMRDQLMQQKEQNAIRKEQGRGRLEQLMSDIIRLGQAKDFSTAEKRISTALIDPLLAEGVDEINRLKETVSAAAQIFQAAGEGLRKQLGKNIILKGKSGVLLSVKEGEIVLDIGKGKIRSKLADMSHLQLSSYARISSLPVSREPYAMAAFLCFASDTTAVTRAKTYIEKAEREGTDVAYIRSIQSRIASKEDEEAPSTPPVSVKKGAGYLELFRPDQLKKWSFVGNGRFDVKRGVASQDGGLGIWYFADKMFGDFVLKVQFKQQKEGNNSGVMFRFQEPRGSISRVYKFGYEIQIGPFGWDRRSTGAVYGYSRPLRALAKAGKWNQLELICIADEAFVRMNDKLVNHFEGLQYTRGYIGLQNMHNVKVYFKDMRVMELGGDLTRHQTRLRNEAMKAKNR